MKSPNYITASELAAYAYCPEQWRLEYGLKLEAGNRAKRKAGSRHHARKAMGERLADGSLMLGWVLMILALIGLLVLFLESQ